MPSDSYGLSEVKKLNAQLAKGNDKLEHEIAVLKAIIGRIQYNVSTGLVTQPPVSDGGVTDEEIAAAKYELFELMNYLPAFASQDWAKLDMKAIEHIASWRLNTAE